MFKPLDVLLRPLDAVLLLLIDAENWPTDVLLFGVIRETRPEVFVELCSYLGEPRPDVGEAARF